MRVMFVAIYKSRMGKKTLIIGASENTDRYAAQAVKLLAHYEHEVIALGKKPGTVHNTKIEGRAQYFPEVDTVSLYINSKIQKMYFYYVISINPKRVIFNPGAENAEFAELLRTHDIEVLNACTLVMLRTGQF